MGESQAASPSRRLLVEERRRLIVDFVEKRGRATVEKLSMTFGTSSVTIGSDLDMLARSAAIARSHGGALPVTQPTAHDTPLNT